MNLQGVFEVLMGEPFLKPMSEIRKLTDWQIQHLIFFPALRRVAEAERRERGKDGKPKRKRKFRLPTKEEYFLVGEKMGVPRAHMEREWASMMEANNGQSEPGTNGTSPPADVPGTL